MTKESVDARYGTISCIFCSLFRPLSGTQDRSNDVTRKMRNFDLQMLDEARLEELVHIAALSRAPIVIGFVSHLLKTEDDEAADLNTLEIQYANAQWR